MNDDIFNPQFNWEGLGEEYNNLNTQVTLPVAANGTWLVNYPGRVQTD